MIESINQAGGGGGGLQGVTAGAGISINNTNPDNPIITNTSLNTDETAKVSSNDTTAGYLNGKLVAGANVTLTENNNGANETLTIAATVPVTSVNTKTGAVTLTNTDVGAAATSHTHAATDITSGVIATARLASAGSASNLTFLRGDQQWASAPVTSVNGLTGAVTVAGGDTTYPLTIQDAENTTATRNLCQFTIPANTFADGELIKVQLWYHANNLSGVAYQFFIGMSWLGAGFGEYSVTTTGGDNGRYGIAEFWFQRSGSQMGVYNAGSAGVYNWSHYAQMYLGPNFFASYVNHPLDTRNWTFLNTNFTSNNTVSITGRWSSANPSAYVRILNARVVKQSGQQT